MDHSATACCVDLLVTIHTMGSNMMQLPHQKEQCMISAGKR
uniref:Uncharacterized protein n=1 Tax=Arundo donax TaxID=35708 RepID=A0A0A9BXC8_ARUDO